MASLLTLLVQELPRPPRQGHGGRGNDLKGKEKEKKPPHPLDFDSVPPQPVREDYMQNAVKFLSHR